MEFQITEIGLKIGLIRIKASGIIKAKYDRIVFGQNIGLLINGKFAKVKVSGGSDKNGCVSFLVLNSHTYICTDTKTSKFPDF